jgi:hypothetical protein
MKKITAIGIVVARILFIGAILVPRHRITAALHNAFIGIDQ